MRSRFSPRQLGYLAAPACFGCSPSATEPELPSFLTDEAKPGSG